MKFAPVILVLAIFLGVVTLGHAEKAFTILEKFEKNYVGLEKEGLNTVIGKASISMFPDADITIYWARDKGVKVKAKGGGPAAMAAPPMVKGFLVWAGLGIERMGGEHGSITPEKVVGKAETATLKGKKVTKLTFTPKEGEDLVWDKLVMMVDTKNWLVMQHKTIAQGEETVMDINWEGNLPSKIVATAGAETTEIKNTYVKKGKVKLLSKQEIMMPTPEGTKEIVITYSDIKINAKIPKEVFEEPKEGDVPKPKESAEELMQQAQAAMQGGDMETAKLKLRQIVTHYPDHPMAPTAKMILGQLP